MEYRFIDEQVEELRTLAKLIDSHGFDLKIRMKEDLIEAGDENGVGRIIRFSINSMTEKVVTVEQKLRPGFSGTEEPDNYEEALSKLISAYSSIAKTISRWKRTDGKVSNIKMELGI